MLFYNCEHYIISAQHAQVGKEAAKDSKWRARRGEAVAGAPFGILETRRTGWMVGWKYGTITA